MNPKIQKLKIENYKKRIQSSIDFCDVEDVLHGEELKSFSSLFQQSSLSKQIIRNEFLYDWHLGFHDSQDAARELFPKAFECFLENFLIFGHEEKVIILIQYQEEYFGLVMNFKVLEDKLTEILEFSQDKRSILVSNMEYTKLISLDRIEYGWEVLHN